MRREFIYIEIIANVALTIIRPLIFVISLSPLIVCILYSNKINYINSYLLMSLSFILIPFLILTIVALLFRLMPDVPNGKHSFFSKHHYIWLFKDLIYETAITSSFLNNVINRIKPIRYVFYSIVKMPNKRRIVLTPDVKILDPDRVFIGDFTFIGINTILSGHIIRSGRLILEKILIGNNNIIGAFCSIACGVITGNNCKIDSFVTLNNNVLIGENTVILGKSLIDSRVKIGCNVRIGKCCVIGSNTIIEDGAIIKDYLRIGSNKLIAKKQIVNNDML
jgi:acetyltransferase-like isoleucine patch superfamily enzyme